ncbi:MAG: hypothetical protein LLG20_18385 [Acidobacteriales bacterium]|nr:hypothetical protein [Terriglobales bacterium]
MSLEIDYQNRIAALEASLHAANERAEKVEKERGEERERADSNFAAYDRIKGKYSETCNKLRYLEECYERAENDVNTQSRERSRAEAELAEARRNLDAVAAACGIKQGQTYLPQQLGEMAAEARRKLAEAQHKAAQYDAVVKALHVCDGGRYRNDTVESVIGAARKLAETEADTRRLRWLALKLSVTHAGLPAKAGEMDEWRIHWKTAPQDIWLMDGQTQALRKAVDAAIATQENPPLSPCNPPPKP